jgi:predicted N-formylglutamate amidohydrolase
LEDVTLPERAIPPGQFVISVEHASNRIPPVYKNLGLTRQQLDAHIAWDPGAKAIARACAQALHCRCHQGRYSRLLIDLNRSLHHPKLITRRSFSVSVPGNETLAPGERERRVRLYHEPFRDAVLTDVQGIIRRHGRCVHLSIHSFTPMVDRVTRNADIGILYDPTRPGERRLAKGLLQRIAAEGFHVRRNYPYRGVSDGHTTHLRQQFRDSNYSGLELEVNQALLQTPAATRHVARKLAEAMRSLAGER